MAWKLIALVLPLGLDTFAIAAAIGIAGIPAARRARISMLMASFEAAMPLVGLALGAPLGRAIGSAADYIAAGVLLAFGVYTLLSDEEREERRLDQLGLVRGWRAALLGLSVSLDELAVGFTFGLLRVAVLPVVLLIGAQALIVSQLGLRLGARLKERTREAAERLAGAALIALAIGLLLEKTLA